VAIFGRIEDLGVPEVLSFLGSHSGRLILRDGATALSLIIDGSKVRCAFLELDPLDQTGLILHLAHLRQGEFRFEPAGFDEDCPVALDVPVERLILELTKFQDELEHYRSQLPHPEVRFRLVRRPNTEGAAIPLIAQVTHLLRKGASARQLAESLGLPVDEARFFLYRLRLLGMIEEVKADRRPAGVKGLLGHLLHALTGGVR